MRNSLSVNGTNASSKRGSDYQTRVSTQVDYQGYTRAQKPEVSKRHFLSSQINDFLQCQQRENQSHILQQLTSQSLMSVRTKTEEQQRPYQKAKATENWTNVDMRTFFQHLTMQKEILEEQQRLHEYQTKIFEKQCKQSQSRSELQNASTRVSRCESQIPSVPESMTSSKNTGHPMIADHIHFIDDDINTLVDFFRKRQLLKRALKSLKSTSTKRMKLLRYRNLCKCFYAMVKHSKQSQIARQERRQMERICETLRY